MKTYKMCPIVVRVSDHNFVAQDTREDHSLVYQLIREILFLQRAANFSTIC